MWTISVAFTGTLSDTADSSAFIGAIAGTNTDTIDNIYPFVWAILDTISVADTDTISITDDICTSVSAILDAIPCANTDTISITDDSLPNIITIVYTISVTNADTISNI
jgi:hypothetical protein